MKIIVPDLGDGITTVEIVGWLAADGARVRKGDDVVELVTDKATFNIAAPADGILKQGDVRPGVPVPIGAVLGDIA